MSCTRAARMHFGVVCRCEIIAPGVHWWETAGDSKQSPVLHQTNTVKGNNAFAVRCNTPLKANWLLSKCFIYKTGPVSAVGVHCFCFWETKPRVWSQPCKLMVPEDHHITIHPRGFNDILQLLRYFSLDQGNLLSNQPSLPSIMPRCQHG